tara:strand:+ start:1367 stop:2866 length:1500 start_codon:yes stop_codon:yes gene_type:complete
MQIYSLQIEKHVLGGLMRNPEVFADVDPFLTEEHFFSPVHGTVYLVIRSCILEGEKVDKVLVANKIQNLGVTFKDEINIFDYVENLAFTQITEKSTLKAAHELHKIKMRRDLRGVLSKSIEVIEKGGNDSFDEIVGKVDSSLNSEINKYGFDSDPENIFEGAQELIEEAGNNPDEEYGLKTSFPEMNRMYGGLRPGNLYAVVARPGQGKTTFLNYIGFQTSISNESKPKVLLLDTEMSTTEIRYRMISSLTGVPVWHLETGNWRKNAEYLEKVREVWPKVKEYEEENLVHHYHVGNKNVDQIASLIRRWYFKNVERGNPYIIVYDYVKLTGENVGKNWAEYQAIGDKIDKLKKIAEETNAVILTAMQLNRSGENFGRNSSNVTDDSSAISLSDRLQWFASFVAIFRRKTTDELALDGQQFGTHKLIPIKTRFQGKDAAGHQDLIRRTIDGKEVWCANYLNFDVENFAVEERGSLADVVDHENANYEITEGDQNDSGDLL